MSAIELVLVWATGLVGIASMAAQELTVRQLPDELATYHGRRRAEVDAVSKRFGWFGPLNKLILAGYFISIAALGFGVSGARMAFAIFTAGYTGLSVFYAPNIHHRIAVFFYEASLLLNGALLAVAFIGSPSPIG